MPQFNVAHADFCVCEVCFRGFSHELFSLPGTVQYDTQTIIDTFLRAYERLNNRINALYERILDLEEELKAMKEIRLSRPGPERKLKGGVEV